MPCDSSYMHGDETIELRRKLNTVTRLLCSVMQAISAADAAELFTKVPGLREWWEEHQRADQEREAREQARRDHQAKHAQALSKLTPAERKILGL